jgi:hypothetical protein
MTITAIKLVTGEEIVGDVTSALDQYPNITIKNPVLVAIQRAQDGQMALAFLPFMPYLGKDVEIDIPRDKTIIVKTVDEGMRNQYNTVFGGILTPTKQLLVS